MKLNRSSRFKRSFNLELRNSNFAPFSRKASFVIQGFKRLPPHIQDDFDKRIKLFFSNPFDPFLKTHKLSGNLADYYAFYLRDGYRVLFDFEESDVVVLVNVGSHDDYKKWSKG